MGEPRARQLHGQPGQATHRPAGLVVQEAVAGVGDARHPGEARGQPAQEAADRHMRMDQVRLLGAQQAHQGGERARVAGGGDAAPERHRLDPEAVGAHLVQQVAIGADADHLMAARPRAAHHRQHEMPQREVDIGDFDDFHRSGAAPALTRKAGEGDVAPATHVRQRLGRRTYPTLVIAHLTCCGPSVWPVSTTCSARRGSGPPR
jgi:hypothetical protein